MTRRFSAAVLCILSAAVVAPLSAQTTRLSPEQVACNGAQLAELATRTTIVRPPGSADKSIGIAYTFASPWGDFSGLAYTQQFEPSGTVAETPEHHLWLSSNPHEVRMLRNPARAGVASLSLTRNALNSDLVPAGDPNRFEVRINPTLASEPVLQTLLRLDNVEGAGGLATSAKPGRGLAGIVRSCHDRFTPADVHVLSLLAKTLRAFPFTADGDSRDSVMAIYRAEGSEPAGAGRATEYRIDVYPLGSPGGERSSFGFEVEIDAKGRLGRARLEALPHCRGGAGAERHCSSPSASAMVVLAEPVSPGQYWTMTPHTPSACTDDLLYLPGCGAAVEVALDQFLAGTTWVRVP